MRVALIAIARDWALDTRASMAFVRRRKINVLIKRNAPSGTNALRVNALRLARQTLTARLDMHAIRC
jgi:hypothetical protein